MTKLKWFTFMQNNSGGFYHQVPDLIAEAVVIQAYSAKQALEIADNLFGDYSDFCSCCGERWSDYLDEGDGHDLPSIFGKAITKKEHRNSHGEKAVLHFISLKTKTIVFKEIEDEAHLKRILWGVEND